MMQQSLLLLAGIASLARASPAAQAKHARQESITPNPSATRTSLLAFDSTGTATTIGPCEWNLRIFLLGTQPTLAPEAAEWFASSIATRSTSPVTHTSQIPSVCSSLINYPNTFTAPPAVKSQYSSWLGEHSSWVDDKKGAASSILSGCTSAQFASLSHSALEALATDIEGCERHQSAVLLYTTPSSTGGPRTPTATSDDCGLALRSIASSKPTQAPEFADWYSSSIVNEISGILTQTTASVESITHVDQLSSLCTEQSKSFQAYPTTFTAAPEIKSYYASYRSAQSAWAKDNEAFVRSVVYTACPSALPILRANAFNGIATDVAGCVEMYKLMGHPVFATETSTFGVTQTSRTAAQQTTNTARTTSAVTGGVARETGYVAAVVAVAAAAVAAL